MRTRCLPVALTALFLASCGGGGGGGNNVRDTPAPSPSPNPPPTSPPPPDPPPTSPPPSDPPPPPVVSNRSIDSVPPEYRDRVRATKSLGVSAEGGQQQLTIDGKTLTPGGSDRYDPSLLENGWAELPMNLVYIADERSQTVQGTFHLYQQPWSIVLGGVYTHDTGTNVIPGRTEAGSMTYIATTGYNTPLARFDTLIAQNAVFDYSGAASNGISRGELNFRIDFAARKGSGSITGIEQTGTITLLEGNLRSFLTSDRNGTVSGRYVGGDALIEKMPTIDAAYRADIFGPDAEEIAGGVEMDEIGVHDVIFGGTRDGN